MARSTWISMKWLKNFYKRLQRAFQSGTANSSTSQVMSSPESSGMPSPEMLMGMISSASDDEIDCDQAFELMHQYADLVDTGQDAAALLPAVHRHIEICKDCSEELEALLRAIHAKG
jgi:hypothetical protein